MKNWMPLGVALLVAGPVPALAENTGDLGAGKLLAEEICPECHAVLPEQFIIPNVDASHFVDIANTPGVTSVALRVMLQSSHEKMPNIILTPKQTNDIIGYILNLKGK